MKILYTFLFLLLFMVTGFQAQAVDVLASELRWKSLGNDSFAITAIIYTDCNGTSLGDTIEVKLQSRDSNNPYTCILKLRAVSSHDVTGQCSNVLTRCQSSTSPFPYGVGKRVYMDSIDLSGQSSCKFRISFHQCCRQGTVYSYSSLYTYCDINSCDTLINSSPVFENEPEFILLAGQCHGYYLNGTDADGDSLAYSLVESQTDSGNFLNYNSPYSYDKPLYFNGIVSPSPILCRSFNLDSRLGVLTFRPMAAQTTWIAVEVTEYRNGIKVGSSRREWQQIVTNSTTTNNKEPEYSGDNIARVCVGDTLKFDFMITDEDSTDTLTVFNWGLMANASITYSGVGDTLFGHLEWICQAAQPKNYEITIKAKDNNCPLPNILIKSLRILVDTFPGTHYTANSIGCGRVVFDATDISGMNYQWQIAGDTLIGRNHTFKFDSGGIKPFLLQAQFNSCTALYEDSVVVPPYNKLIISAGADTIVCRNDSFSLTPTIISGNGSYSYLWLPDSVTTMEYRGLKNTATNFTIEVTDVVGCTASDQISVFLLPSPTVSTKTIKTCGTADTLNLSGYAAPVGGTWSGRGVIQNQIALSKAVFGDWMHYEYTDTNGCSSNDSAQLAMGQAPIVSAGTDISVCLSVGLMPLTGNPANGSWTGTGAFKSGVQWYFNPATAGVGTTALVYSFTDSVFCTSSDTLSASVYPLPVLTMPADFTRCIDAASVSLSAQPTGGSWSGTGVVAGVFYPTQVSPGIYYLHYSYTDGNGCTQSDSIKATIVDLPQVDAGTDISACISGWPVQLSPSPAGGTWLGSPAVVGGNFYPSVAGLGTHYLRYSYTNANGCTNIDSLKATVVNPPQVTAYDDTTVCIHENPLNLSGQPAGGIWTGAGVTGNIFTAAAAGTGIHELIYTYTGLCVNSDTIKINVLPRPALTASFTPVSKYQMQFNLASPDSLIDFQWDFGDGDEATQRNPVHTYPTAVGNYQVIARSTGDNGCWNADTLQVLISNTALQEMPWLKNVKVYPNPATQKLVIETQNGMKLNKAVLQNAMGEEVMKLELIDKHFEAKVSELPAGVYFLELFNSANERAVVRVVVQ